MVTRRQVEPNTTPRGSLVPTVPAGQAEIVCGQEHREELSTPTSQLGEAATLLQDRVLIQTAQVRVRRASSPGLVGGPGDGWAPILVPSSAQGVEFSPPANEARQGRMPEDQRYLPQFPQVSVGHEAGQQAPGVVKTFHEALRTSEPAEGAASASPPPIPPTAQSLLYGISATVVGKDDEKLADLSPMVLNEEQRNVALRTVFPEADPPERGR